MKTRLKMANTGHVSVASLPLGWLGIRTDVELVAQIPDTNRCELGAYESEHPVRSDSGGCTSEHRISVWSGKDIPGGVHLVRIARELISA
jgi:hypothetical protein